MNDDFLTWIMENERIQIAAAREYRSSINRLRSVASDEEIIYGNVHELVDRVLARTKTVRHRSRRAQPLRRAARHHLAYVWNMGFSRPNLGGLLI